jgi:hypothetical protein
VCRLLAAVIVALAALLGSAFIGPWLAGLALLTLVAGGFAWLLLP